MDKRIKDSIDILKDKKITYNNIEIWQLLNRKSLFNDFTQKNLRNLRNKVITKEQLHRNIEWYIENKDMNHNQIQIELALQIILKLVKNKLECVEDNLVVEVNQQLTKNWLLKMDLIDLEK